VFPDLTREDLERPGVQLFNRGGPANPDVLLVQRDGWLPLVVKDYSRCAGPVRWTLAPLLVWHELSMLGRARGLPGVPEPRGRIDALALAIEFIPGAFLRRELHGAALPRVFFDALEGILEGLAQRGLLYTDLRSPSNILVTPGGGPAIVDLASAIRLPIPGAVRGWYERRALGKLRRRFEGTAEPSPLGERPGRDLDLGRVRVRVVDRGRHDDPVPALFLHDAGLASVLFEGVLDRAGEFSRRGISIDVPGFASSRVPRRRLGLRASSGYIEDLLDALRLPRVDLFGWGWGGVLARDLATRRQERVRSLITLDAPVDRIEGRFRERWQEGIADPELLRSRLLREIPAGLDPDHRKFLERMIRIAPAARLSQVYRAVPVRRSDGEDELLDLPRPEQPWLAVDSVPGQTGAGSSHPRRVCWADPLADPDRLWREFGALALS
jgi:pimeloyl-ACP methyl ester carboxylesterase